MLIRLPRTGGTVRAYIYPKLDSAVWTGHTTSVERVLGFDPEGGALAIVDAKGQPARVDFRLGQSTVASKAKLASLSAPSGTDIYGIDPKGTVDRLTRAGDWSFAPPVPARAVFPQRDGSLLIAAQKGPETLIWQLHPPDTQLRDTAVLDGGPHAVGTEVGDRVYFATDTALIGVRARDLSVLPPIRVKGPVTAMAPTPSGDRVYVALAHDSAIAVIDRYTDKIASTIGLPGPASDLRMDRLGRYVIARPARGDSAWVIAVATDRVVGSVHTKWTEDLPAAAPDGAIATNTGRDVVFVDGETLQPVRTVAGGASDFWYFIFWNGFRPRAPGVDQPVSFASSERGTDDSGSSSADSTRTVSDSAVAAATAGVPSPNTTGATAEPARPVPARVPPAAAAHAPVARAPVASAEPGPHAHTPGANEPFTVSFAAMLTEDNARALADSIEIEGAKPRVVPSQRAGTTIYRVVLGPYPDRAAADRIGRLSKRSYWVFPGQP